jgi:hypothetical protein
VFCVPRLGFGAILQMSSKRRSPIRQRLPHREALRAASRMDATGRRSLARNNETVAPPSAVSAFGVQGVALKPHSRIGEQSVESSGNVGHRGVARAEFTTQSKVAGRKVSDVIAKYNTAPTWWLSHCNCTPRCSIFTRVFPPPVLCTHVLELNTGCPTGARQSRRGTSMRTSWPQLARIPR